MGAKPASLPASSDALSVSGKLSRRDLKRLTGTTRSGTVGPTTVYYAGVTAPIISAGASVGSRGMLMSSGLSGQWVFLLSAIIAAFAGISWYLIFMRWSYRQTHGRAGEGDAITSVDVTDDGLIVHRGHVTTKIGWPAIQEIRRGRKFIAILMDGSDTVLIPDHWFGKDKVKRDAFRHTIEGHLPA